MATFSVIITGVRVFSATQVSPKQNYIAETLGLQKKKEKRKKTTNKLDNMVFPLIITIISSFVIVALAALFFTN